MKKKELIPFYVIREEYGKFVPYNIMDYLIRVYMDKKKTDRPTEYDGYKDFIKKESMYQWWARCEYEILLLDWPCQKKSEKWDVYKQILMNLDLITRIFIENIKK